MSIVPSNRENEQNVIGAVLSFMQVYHLSALLRKCGCKKEQGISFVQLFVFILCNVFRDRSIYMQWRTNQNTDEINKNTYYRFMQNVHANWLRFTTLLSANIINGHLRHLTSDKRVDCFVVDDSLYERAGYKRTELASCVFDHVSMRYKKGFRLMTLGWTDGYSFIPVNFSLLASSNSKNILGKIVNFAKNSVAGKRRIMAQSKGTDVIIQLIDLAMKAGHRAKFVLFDSWFSNPHQIVQLKDRGLDTIAMLKISSRIKYVFDGKRQNIKQIYGACKKRRGRSRYLLSVAVKLGQNKKDEHEIDARIVCVRNRANRKEWLALVCTDMSLSEDEIIRIYGKRWDIEVFFKTCKSFLRLRKEYHGLSYDALTAHVAMVFTRYMLMSVAKRDDNDDRTIGELFYLMIDEVRDITFSKSMQILVEAMLSSVQRIFHATDEQIEALMNEFIGLLPEYMRNLLTSASLKIA